MPVDGSPVLILFARRPDAGEAKTRLAPALGPEGAARLAHRMIEWSVDNATRSWPGPVRLAVWPPGSDAWFAASFDVPVSVQRGADLGERMNAAIADAGGPVAVLGCDVPHLTGAVLSEAAGLLRAGRDVVGPAVDGGFYLLGLQCVVSGLFDGIAWGAGDVRKRLLDNARSLGLDPLVLTEARDIDRPEDLAAVGRQFDPLRRFLKEIGGAARG